jgi:2-dehydropantoate 2-reductase
MEGAMNARPRILVMGAGGIGGIVAATLTEAGADVTAVSTNPTIRVAVAAEGFRVVELAAVRRGRPAVARAIAGRIVAAPDGVFDVCILATQPPQVEDAARTALPFLAADGCMVVLPNGLCEERVAAIAGVRRTIGAIVAWGASMPEPGRYERTAPGGFAVGALDPAAAADAAQIAALLAPVGPVTITANLRGARWSKLALDCAISSLPTIAGERLGPLVRVRRYRRLALEIMSEVVAVAHAEGVRLEKVAGTLDLDWIALTAAERAAFGSASLTAKHALLLAVGLKYRRMRSSMLAAIERGRIPAIDFLNGEVTSRAARHGLTAAKNARVVATIWAIARGEVTSSRALLDGLCG